MAKNKNKKEKNNAKPQDKNQEKVENTEETKKEETTTEEEAPVEEKVVNEYDVLLDKFNTLNDRYLRMSAEYDNYRKRTLKEKMDLIKTGGSDVLKGILPVIDNFERAFKALDESNAPEGIKDGIEIIYNEFNTFLKQRGVVEIEAMNLPLDTDMHEAIAQLPSEDESKKGLIIDVIEKGYMISDKVLRFAKVVVAK
jgi:molecular chaperone GrpE